MPDQLGYPDFRRRSDYDGETFVANPSVGTARTGIKSYGPFYVGDMAFLTFYMVHLNALSLQFLVTWYVDAALSIVSATRTFWRSSAHMQLRLPNLGRWVTLDIIPQFPATNWTDDLVLFPSNRGDPIEAYPEDGSLLNNNDPAGAGVVLTKELGNIYAGPVLVRFGSFDVAWKASLDLLTGYGVWGAGPFYETNGAAGANDQRILILPLSQCRLRIQNTAGVPGNLFSSIIHSTSGAG